MREDSGWRFLSGDESDDYLSDPQNSDVYDLNTICNYDTDIIPFLSYPAGSAFERDLDGHFILLDDRDSVCSVTKQTGTG